MAFKLTYSDGQESQHGDDTTWELDNGVLKLGREEGKWSVLLSPSHWAVLELVASGSNDKDGDKSSNDDDSGKGSSDEDRKSDDDSDDDDSDKSKDKDD